MKHHSERESRPAIPAEIQRQILIECGHRCSVCGEGTPLERAHIIEWRYSKEHKAEDMICLCANCHARADKENWERKTLREYKKKPWVIRRFENTKAIPESETKTVVIKVEKEIEHLDETQQRYIQYAIAAFLEVPPNHVKIVSVVQGSTKLTVSVPKKYKERLKIAYEEQLPEFIEYLEPLVTKHLIPEWRLRLIRNIADALAFRAGCCPVPRHLMLAEKKYLKPNAHIRMLFHPGLKKGEAKHYVQRLSKRKYADNRKPVDLFSVTIYFHSDLSSNANREKSERSVIRELGHVIFFSEAARRKTENVTDHEAYVETFVDEIMKHHYFPLDSARPRFTLAKLRQIVEQELHPRTKEVLTYLPKLLRPYLGPDGW